MTQRYIADSTHGRLAKWLRLLGVDVDLFGRGDFASLVKRARASSQKIITGRKKTLGHPVVLIQAQNIQEQVEEFYALEGLTLSMDKIFTRCSECNRELGEIQSEEAGERGVPEFVLLSHERFLACDKCKRVYWPGSHRERFMEIVNTLHISGR